MAEKTGIVRYEGGTIESAVKRSSNERFIEGMLVGGLASLAVPLVVAYGDQHGWMPTQSGATKRWVYAGAFGLSAFLLRKSAPGLALGLAIGAVSYAILPMAQSAINQLTSSTTTTTTTP